MLLATVSYVDRQTVSILSIAITKSLDISEAEWGWVVSMFSLAYLVGTPLGGWWIGRVGARRGLVIALVIWSAVAALHALVPSLGALIVLRIALGITEGPGYPAASQSMHRIFPPVDRARGFGMLFVGASLGTMVAGPLASTLYRETGGWRLAFLGTALVGLLWLVPWIALTRRPEMRAKLDERDTDAPRATFRSLPQIALHPAIRRAVVAVFVTAPIMGFVFGWSAKYLGKAFAVTQGDVGDYVWLPALAFDVGALLYGYLAARHRRASESSPRLLVTVALALALVIALVPTGRTAWEATILFAIAMTGVAGLLTLVTSDALARIPGEQVALASGVLAGAQSLSMITLGPLIGWSIGRRGDYVEATIGLGALLLPGTIAWLVWPSRVRGQ
jgi:MFS transporter, ACS family, hexuronate transporter